jgi:hypothetical protein
LEGAPGWRVVERAQQRSWRVGYVIVPLAILVGSLQVLIPSDANRGGWSQDRRQASPADAPAPTTEGAIDAPRAQRQAQQLPESTGRSAEPQRAPLPDARPLASSNPPADEATAAGPTPMRVFIHHTAGAENALPAIQLAAFLQARGFDVVDIRPVDVEIERPSVRYFFDGDQPESGRLVEAIGAFYAKARGRAPDEAADFSHFSPKPRRGNIEVWLPAPAAGESQSS